MNNYLIYRHIKTDGTTFYIGISKNKKRPYDKHNRNRFWKSTIEKYKNYEIQILKRNLTQDEACELEQMLIAYYGLRINNTGTLVNLTYGGEKKTKQIVSQETREKMSKSRKNKKQSKSWVKKRVDKLIGKKRNDSFKKEQSLRKIKIVLDSYNGIYYTINELATIYIIPYGTVANILNGTNKKSKKIDNKRFFYV